MTNQRGSVYRTSSRRTGWAGGTYGAYGGIDSPAISTYDPGWFTYNLCPNPSFEQGLYGWQVTDPGTIITQVESPSPTMYGQFAMAVQTSGTMSQQGVFGPMAMMPYPSCSVTIGIWGESGVFNVTAISNYGGVELVNQVVQLSGSTQFTVVQLNNIQLPGESAGLYVAVTTVSPQVTTFYVDGVMYEPETPAHAYCDGSMPNCYWTGTPGLSSSYQPFQFGVVAVSSLNFNGSCRQPYNTATAEVFPILVESTGLVFSGGYWGGPGGPGGPSGIPLATLVQPVAALTDFGIWETGTDPDPAMTYCWFNNQGCLSGYTEYNRPYGMFVPPLAYPVSTGLAWNQAAYAAVGFQWAAVASGQYQVLTDIQFEMAPISGGTNPGPRGYQKSRQLQVTVKPDRLNYITNPSFETSSAGWTGSTGNESLTSTSSVPPPTGVAEYNNTDYSPGTWTMSTVVPANGTGCQISVPYLIPGYIYTASAYVLTNNEVGDMWLSIGGQTGDLLGLVGTGYGAGAYGAGPYGGMAGIQTPLAPVWQRVWVTFTAAADTETLVLQPIAIQSAVYPLQFWTDAVLCEDGDILLPYFDGNSGLDALWETGGTPNLARSYYYSQFQYGQQVVTSQLAANTPMGISSATPQYGQVPTQ